MKRRSRRLDEISPGRIYLALNLTTRYMERVVLPRARSLAEVYGGLDIDFKDVYAALRLAALRAAAGYRSAHAPPLRKYLWNRLHWALKVELRRQWYLPEAFVERYREQEEAGAWLTPDLLPPRPLSEITDPTPDRLTHLLDDLPDRDGRATHDAAVARIQARQVRALLQRLPRRFRGPVWRVHALGEDAFTASRALGLSLPQCWALARDGLARLQKMIARDPSLLLPPDD